MTTAVLHGSGCRGLLLDTLIDDRKLPCCSACGVIVTEARLACGSPLPSGEDECHCAGCHGDFATDAEFFAYQPCQGTSVVTLARETAGQGTANGVLRGAGTRSSKVTTNGAPAASQQSCRRGHPWSKSNTYVRLGKRYCRACRREASRDQRA